MILEGIPLIELDNDDKEIVSPIIRSNSSKKEEWLDKYIKSINKEQDDGSRIVAIRERNLGNESLYPQRDKRLVRKREIKK